MTLRKTDRRVCGFCAGLNPRKKPQGTGALDQGLAFAQESRMLSSCFPSVRQWLQRYSKIRLSLCCLARALTFGGRHHQHLARFVKGCGRSQKIHPQPSTRENRTRCPEKGRRKSCSSETSSLLGSLSKL